ncbi:hypothetical protein MUP01_00530 [Candidatus Bathyarchaeota archaeon]|nr:hypothetical protein [Candidatus Bathyarchaeota archaeon]
MSLIWRNRRGIGFVLIIIVIVAIVVVFTLVLIRSTQLGSTPSVQDSYWVVAGKRSPVATVGQEVEAHIIIEAKEEYIDSVVVKIRKDVSYLPDTDYATTIIPVDVKGGQTTDLEVVFTPDQASTGNLRGYFIEVSYSKLHTNWVMDNAYPPRLKVQVQN